MKAMRAAKVDSPRGELTFQRNGFPVQDYSVWKVVSKDKDTVGFKMEHVVLKAHGDAYVKECPANP